MRAPQPIRRSADPGKEHAEEQIIALLKKTEKAQCGIGCAGKVYTCNLETFSAEICSLRVKKTDVRASAARCIPILCL
jgi:hypothetical protein